MKSILALLPILAAIAASGCVSEPPIGGDKDAHGCLVAAGYSYSDEASACVRQWELDDNQLQAAGIAVEHVGYEKGITVTEALTNRCPGCFTITLHRGDDTLQVTLMDWEVTEVSESDGTDRYFVYYENGSVNYNITVAKPSPCHTLDVRKSVMESYPVQIRLDISILPPEEGEMCAQVITEDTICGDIGTGHKPASAEVWLDGSRVYYTTFHEAPEDRHYCTEEEKAAEFCTMEYNPVCGWDEIGVPKTYSNPCMACAAGVEYWEPGECEIEGMSPLECEVLGGRALNIVGGAECYSNETNAGRVFGFISPNICCVPNPEL